MVVFNRLICRMTIMFKKMLLLVLLAFITRMAEATYEADPAIRARNKARVEQIFKSNQEKYKGNSDMLVLPGLIADRKAKHLSFLAESTGLSKGSPIEFFLVGENSGHAYEALSVSFASPGNVQKALEFIGMLAGRSSDLRKCLFWPKGERVITTFSSLDPDIPLKPIRAEKLVLDSRTKKTLPDCGLVFTGSIMIEMPDQPDKKVMAVDAREPNSIASTYNAFETVIDVPFSWSQKSAYGNILVNESHLIKAGCFMKVTMEPEYKDGKKRVIDLQLEMAIRPDSQGKTIDDIDFRVQTTAGEKLNKDFTLNTMLKLFDSLNNEGHDPFVAVRLPDGMTAKAASEICSILSKIDTEHGIRIEPPDNGHLYYRAFTPNEKMRNRADRFAQPLELGISITNAGVVAVLTKIQQVWKSNTVDPDLKADDYPVNTPEELQKKLKEIGTDIPVIFVFADPCVTYGQIMSYIRPVLESFPMIHVYVK
ncbi:MAG: hypothetical protein A2283_13360 [Lentisphaerae bacterium RIFOXYA12_FULL_48_11]|nr:MAG: hypothetical protein A2283_13360 [Lentisphaerae bacterium RIFOXYA12_FULL_48_11]